MTPTDPEALERRRVARNARLRVMRREARGLPADAVMVSGGGHGIEGPEDWPELHTVPYERDPIARTVVIVCGDDMMTHEDIGVLMHIGRERVRQIEKGAIAQVASALRRLDIDARDWAAWFDSKSRSPEDTHASGIGGADGGVATKAASEAETVSAGAYCEATLALERGLDAIRETAAAHRMVERVVCGMEIAGGAW